MFIIRKLCFPRDSNPHTKALVPKTSVSTNFTRKALQDLSWHQIKILKILISYYFTFEFGMDRSGSKKAVGHQEDNFMILYYYLLTFSL